MVFWRRIIIYPKRDGCSGMDRRDLDFCLGDIIFTIRARSSGLEPFVFQVLAAIDTTHTLSAASRNSFVFETHFIFFLYISFAFSRHKVQFLFCFPLSASPNSDASFLVLHVRQVKSFGGFGGLGSF